MQGRRRRRLSGAFILRASMAAAVCASGLALPVPVSAEGDFKPPSSYVTIREPSGYFYIPGTESVLEIYGRTLRRDSDERPPMLNWHQGEEDSATDLRKLRVFSALGAPLIQELRRSYGLRRGLDADKATLTVRFVLPSLVQYSE